MDDKIPSVPALKKTESITSQIFNVENTRSALRWCSEIASSDLIPAHFRGRTANVFLIFYRAHSYGMNPLDLMQVSYIVGDKIAFEAKLLVAQINSSGLFKGILKRRYTGEIKWREDGLVSPESTRECTVYTIEKETNEKLENSCHIQMAFREGWIFKTDRHGNNCSKWNTMPDEMLFYRAAAFFGNMYCPHVIMGMHVDEINEVQDAEYTEITGTDDHGSSSPAQKTAAFHESEADNQAGTRGPGNDIRSDGGKFPQGTPEAPSAPASISTSPEPPSGAAGAPSGPSTAPPPLTPAGDPQAVENDDNPPYMPAFAEWFKKRFADETASVDSFLRLRDWLKNGESHVGYSNATFAKLRLKWSDFIYSYRKYLANRKQA